MPYSHCTPRLSWRGPCADGLRYVCAPTMRVHLTPFSPQSSRPTRTPADLTFSLGCFTDTSNCTCERGAIDLLSIFAQLSVVHHPPSNRGQSSSDWCSLSLIPPCCSARGPARGARQRILSVASCSHLHSWPCPRQSLQSSPSNSHNIEVGTSSL